MQVLRTFNRARTILQCQFVCSTRMNDLNGPVPICVRDWLEQLLKSKDAPQKFRQASICLEVISVLPNELGTEGSTGKTERQCFRCTNPKKFQKCLGNRLPRTSQGPSEHPYSNPACFNPASKFHVVRSSYWNRPRVGGPDLRYNCAPDAVLCGAGEDWQYSCLPGA